MASSKPGAVTTGAGLSMKTSGADNPNPIQHGGMGQAERAFSAGSTFLSGVMAISASQFIGAPLKLVDPKFYEDYMAWTKESFAVLMTTITQWWSPTVVRVSGDESMKGQLYQMEDGTLKCNFPHRLVLMANHQLYTDWLYLWWIAYTNKMHGRIYIILKESLKSLPIIGWAAQFYNFIFLSRKWETDKFRFKRALNHLRNPDDPMWLLIFPEGTNLSAVTREKSASWAKKSGVPDMKHQLLPRQTGLQFCLSELKSTTNWLYDCTVAYEGVPKGMYGQDIFTLRSSFFEGRPPKSVNMFWRRYRISEIPVDNDEAFGRWLNNRWREKDYILEYFYKFGSFPADDPVKALEAVAGKAPPNHARAIATEVKGGGWDEFLSIFGPITSAAGAFSSIDMTEPVNFDSLMTKVAQQQQLNLLNLGKSPLGTSSQETIKKALLAANKSKALPDGVLQKLLQAPPRTQEDMKQLLAKSGNPEVARKVANAPASKKAISSTQQQNIAQTQQQIMGGKPGATAKAPFASGPMPMANLEAMITRPLSTMAVQTAAATIKNAASQRTKTKGAALPGQSLPTRKINATVGNGVKGKPVSKAPSVISNASAKTTKTTAAKPSSVKGTPAKSPAAKVSTVTTKKKSAGSRAIGTQKYPTGTPVT